MSRIIRIAIDGPSGAGKSTVAKAVAKELQLDYIDTGAMYRAFGYKLLKKNVELSDIQGVKALLENTDIDFSDGNIFLDGENINGFIRTPEIAAQASACSAIKEVREKLVSLQQEMGRKKSVIMDGRDIGTVVFPDAEYKFYITASPEERANRRYRELVEKGQEAEYEQVLKDINQRDYNDMTRENSPLRKADDAVEVDTTEMTMQQVVDYVCKAVK